MGFSQIFLALWWIPSGHLWCYAFVLLSSSAAAGNSRILELGSTQGYKYTSTILLNEADQGGNTVGYQVTANVGVSVVWDFEGVKLLYFELNSPKLLIQSREAPQPKGFVVHKSKLEGMKNSAFLVEWRQGVIGKIYTDKQEDISMKNLKKGIASIFQFQITDFRTEETDISGTCQVSYHSVDPYTIIKTKDGCRGAPGVPYIQQEEPVLKTNVRSERSAVYTLSKDLTYVESVKATENHAMNVVVKVDAASGVSASYDLVASDFKPKAKLLKAGDLTSAIKEFQKNTRTDASGGSITAEITPQSCSKGECPLLPQLVKDNRESLQDSAIGTVRSANAFIKLLAAGRNANEQEIAKAFKGAKNKDIMLQLSDLAGAINTPEVHEVIKKLINFEDDADLDKAERYLWAISTVSHPKVEIIRDLFKMSQRPSNNPKIAETLILTVAALTRRFRSLPGVHEDPIIQDVANAIVTDLEKCKEDECKHKYLRALRNLQCPSTIPLLVQYALNGKSKTSVEAMKTLRSFPARLWSDSVVDAAQRIYFMAGRRYDSSSRTLAIDILLESNPRIEVLRELIASLLERDAMFEVKQYLNQRLKQLLFEKSCFGETVDKIMVELKSSFSNYHSGAIRGLTTAFSRPIAQGPTWNGHLVNIQEVSGGLLKRGIVDIVLSAKNSSTSIFTLGLFAGGLSSFVSSNDASPKDNNEVVEEEVATAGMELAVLGTRIRPFVFFTGQGELMGHVWSGTASEKTPAYQSFIVTHDHLEHIVLQNGITTQLQVLGAVSFDLSGQIQMSLWNRNAHSLVEENAGVALQGRIQVDTSFVKSQVEFNVGTEVKLNLISDLSFYDGVKLCMQLVQPNALLKHNVHKIERIIGSKHRLRKSKYKQINLPGRTYVLNQKNNEMCNALFQK